MEHKFRNARSLETDGPANLIFRHLMLILKHMFTNLLYASRIQAGPYIRRVGSGLSSKASCTSSFCSPRQRIRVSEGMCPHELTLIS